MCNQKMSNLEIDNVANKTGKTIKLWNKCQRKYVMLDVQLKADSANGADILAWN